MTSQKAMTIAREIAAGTYTFSDFNDRRAFEAMATALLELNADVAELRGAVNALGSVLRQEMVMGDDGVPMRTILEAEVLPHDS
jgi:hypothetical protein